MLTQELLNKGSVPRFCAIVRKLKRSTVLVNCDCKRDALGQLCQELGVTCVDFEDTEDAFAAGRNSGSAASIDLTVLQGPVGMGCVGDYEQSRLKPLLENLRGSEPVAAVVDKISQAALLNLCTQLKSAQKPLLYAMSNYHYAKCYRNLISAGNTKSGQKRMNSAIGSSEESTCVGSLGTPSPLMSRKGDYDGDMTPSADHSHAFESKHPVSKVASMKEEDNFIETKENFKHRTSVESQAPLSSSHMMSLRSDPAPHFQMKGTASMGNSALKTQSMVPQLGGGADEIFVSVNSIGIVSDSADCVLFKTDLGCLGDAMEIVGRRLRR